MQSHFTLVSDGPQQLPPPPTPRFNGYMHRRPVDLRESTNLYMPDLAGLWAEMHDLYMPLDQAWWPTAGGRYERRAGIMFPFFRSEQDLDWLRSASRYVAGYHRGHAGGLIRGYCGYVIGKGMTCKPTPIDGTSDPADMALVKAAEKELQDFSDRVLWPELQQELFCNSLIDGDSALWMFDLGDHLDVRMVLPENIRQPMGYDAKEWGFGRHTPADDVQRTIGWHVMDPDDYGAGTFIQDADFVYLPFVGPGGWNRTIRRGVPIFAFTTKTVIDCASKIENNMGEGVAIRQAIPYIEQQAEFTSREDAAADADFTADVKITDPLGSGIQRNIRKARPGRVPRIPDGYAFVNPPAHPETESAINAIDAMIRAACSVLNAPHWMAGTSGRDAMAYTAELVKESPLVKTGEQIQEAYGNRFLKMMRKVLEIAVRCGRLRPETLTRLRLTMEHPSMAAQDPDAEATRDQMYVGMGAKSIQAVQQEHNWDVEKTRAEIAEFNKWKAMTSQQGQPPAPAPQNGGEQPKPGETQPLVPGIDDEDADPFGEVKEAVLREAFTGMKTDSLGRKMYYQDGKHIAHPSDEQKKDIERKGAGLVDKQHVTKSPAFQEWFGESKVVDEEGMPLRVFHGTGTNFEEFDPDKVGTGTDVGRAGAGFYFSDDPKIASSYATMSRGNAQIVPVYVSIKNPLILERQEGEKMNDAAVRLAKSLGVTEDPQFDGAQPKNPEYARQFRELAMAAGYDGVITKFGDGRSEFTAYGPTQVKSATGNRGTFDPKSSKINESIATMDKSDLCETARKLGMGDVRALGREAIRAKLRERLTPDLREAFTGMKTDSLGRKMYYQDGKHIAHPSDEQKKEIEKGSGETPAEPKTSDDVHDIFRGLQQVESDGYETDEHTGEVSTNNFFKKTSKGEMSDVVFAMEKLHKQSGGGDSLAPTLEKHATQQEVKIADLKSTQPTVEEFKVAGLLSPAGAKRLASDAPRDLPVVVKYGGQLYAYDGQHRLTAKLIAGNDTAKVNYIDLDAMGGK